MTTLDHTPRSNTRSRWTPAVDPDPALCDLPPGHPTGSRLAWDTGCRCPRTMDYHRTRLAVDRRRRQQTYLGTYTPDATIDATQAAVHLDALMAAGNSRQAIYDATGVSVDTLYRVRRGHPIRRTTAERLLAYPGERIPRRRRDHQTTTATMWRLRALARLGHTTSAVADLAPVPPDADPRLWVQSRRNTLQMIRAGRSHWTTDPVVGDTRAAYEQLWDQAPDESTRTARIGSTRARNIATAHGWPAPMDLDDDLIHDPAYDPTATDPC